ncbi:MAG TPA: dTDP-4-dehydrorhamnose 3,5-epimerase [Candidatus Binatia bacterium]|nr:dTDP-4-dehydrorhamnose 3,5-epimerase [Candidatus Binatia bacterium]
MPFEFSRGEIPDVILIQPRLFRDGRGCFMETYKRSDFAAHGIAESFVQSNHSRSARGILRGLHFQKHPKAQGKLVCALSGEIFDVAVDLRLGSPSYGKWLGSTLSGDQASMLYIPPGFAHGFCVTSAEAEVLYMTTEEYAPAYEAGIVWNDPDLAIRWPLADPQLSERDRHWPRLRAADNNFDFYGALRR